MPQLDKYIFYNHILTLSIFFLLIYIFIRGSVIPTLSSIIKYRKKKLDDLTDDLSSYNKLLNFSKTKFDNKGKLFINKLNKQLSNLIVFYNLNLNKNTKIADSSIYVFIRKHAKNIFNILYKNKKESKRLTNFV